MSPYLASPNPPLQNLESMPGGQAILQRMYRDVQEPVLNAMGGPNPFQVLPAATGQCVRLATQDLRGQAAPVAPTPSTETTTPAPNPWAAPGATPASTARLGFVRNLLKPSTSGYPLPTSCYLLPTPYLTPPNPPQHPLQLRGPQPRRCPRAGGRHVHQPRHAEPDGADEREPHPDVPDDVCSLHAEHVHQPGRQP